MSKSKKKIDNDDEYIKVKKTTEEVKEKKKEVKKEIIDDNEEILEEEEVTTMEEREIPKPDKEIPKERKVYKHTIGHSFLIIVLLTSLAYFIISLFYTKTDSIPTLINSLLLMLFTLLFVSVSITTNRKNKSGFFLSAFLLFGYFVFGILMTIGVISFPENKVINFTGKNLTEVIKWSEKYNIDIVQDYEYSDMVEEYSIINQDVEPGTKIKDVESITVAVSEGPNPSKEVVVPNMVTWDSERVLEFIKANYLSNVVVEFVESSKAVDTVIEQSKSGNLKRDEELKLVFSYGEELGYDEVKLIDFSGKSKFEVTFYLKQHQLNYEFVDEFSSEVKRGYAVSQSVEPGTMVKVNGDKIKIGISKGPEIKIPDLREMSMSEITEWVIKNKLKLEFTDKYDDEIQENNVISANYDAGEVVAEGTVIEVVISRGKLTMPEFESYNEFREWAEKYGVNYEEQHDFSKVVKAGEVISYSYKTGETIKNNDSIIVVISDGEEAEVPDVIGLTKAQATTKLKNAGFKHNFVYSYSNTVAEGKVIKQSISAGSKVAQGTTVTVTISNGKKPASSGGSSNSGGSSSGGNTAPTCTSTATHTLIIQPNWVQGGSANATISTLKSKLAANYPNVTFAFTTRAGNDPSGYIHVDSPITNRSSIQDCKTYTIIINE